MTFVPKPQPTPPPQPSAFVPRLVTMAELHMGADCRWPFGESNDPGFRYCGAPRQFPGQDEVHCYCAVHARKAYTAARRY
jgi:hypothetical protein